MNDPQMRQAQGKRRSSKEVLQDIKKYYAAKQFDQALKLCGALLKKHPNNADLQGLFKKIENRVNQQKAEVSPPTASPATDGQKFENTMILQQKAEKSLNEPKASPAKPTPSPEPAAQPSEDSAKQVEKLIQNGVSLYDVQDYEQAIATWEKALELDPGNRIAQDYINNVRPLLEEEQAEPEPAVAPAVAEHQAASSAKPGKTEMVKVYNEAMQLYKAKQFQPALDKWNYILQFYPRHKETLQCVRKTEAVMAKLGLQPTPTQPEPTPAPTQPTPVAMASPEPEIAVEASSQPQGGSVELDLGIEPDQPAAAQEHDPELLAKLEKARSELASGNHVAAEIILTRLSIEAPDLPGLDQVKESLQQRKKQITELRSMELEDSEEETEYSATDDDITKFFTPESDGEKKKARQVAEVIVPTKQKKKPNMFLLAGVPILLVALGAGGWFGYDYYNKNLAPTSQEPVILPVMREVDWNSDRQKTRDFTNLAEDLSNEGSFLLAGIAYDRVVEVANPRLGYLADQGIGPDDFELREELNDLRQNSDDAKSQKAEVLQRFNPTPIDEEAWDTEVERASAEIERGRYNEAVSRLTDLLGNKPEDESVRKLLGNAEMQLGFRRVSDQELDEALSHFKRATVLLPSFDGPRRHKEVIERFFTGRITKEEKDQWFFFYLD